jgi:hypothetical protein
LPCNPEYSFPTILLPCFRVLVFSLDFSYLSPSTFHFFPPLYLIRWHEHEIHLIFNRKPPGFRLCLSTPALMGAFFMVLLFPYPLRPFHLSILLFKCSVYRKQRWVKSGVIQRVWASHRGAEYYCVNLGGLHLMYSFFPFPVCTAQFIGEFWKNRRSGTSDTASIVLALYSSHS